MVWQHVREACECEAFVFLGYRGLALVLVPCMCDKTNIPFNRPNTRAARPAECGISCQDKGQGIRGCVCVCVSCTRTHTSLTLAYTDE